MTGGFSYLRFASRDLYRLSNGKSWKSVEGTSKATILEKVFVIEQQEINYKPEELPMQVWRRMDNFLRLVKSASPKPNKPLI